MYTEPVPSESAAGSRLAGPPIPAELGVGARVLLARIGNTPLPDLSHTPGRAALRREAPCGAARRAAPEASDAANRIPIDSPNAMEAPACTPWKP